MGEEEGVVGVVWIRDQEVTRSDLRSGVSSGQRRSGGGLRLGGGGGGGGLVSFCWLVFT